MPSAPEPCTVLIIGFWRVSSWRRISPDSLIPQAKATGQYLNSILAKIEAHKSGYEEAILLDDHGYVCEGTGENLFVVRGGKIHTPPLSSSPGSIPSTRCGSPPT